MRWAEWVAGKAFDAVAPSWALVYATADAPIAQALRDLAVRYPGIKTFGATSFRGVFTPKGFARGVFVLFGEAEDEVAVAPCSVSHEPWARAGRREGGGDQHPRDARPRGHDAPSRHARLRGASPRGVSTRQQAERPHLRRERGRRRPQRQVADFEGTRIEGEGFVLTGGSRHPADSTGPSSPATRR